MATHSESTKPSTGAVFAVVVTYNPDDNLPSRLRALRGQVETLLVIDNGSGNAAAVHAMALDAGCSVILNPKNLGVAEALNQGARAAQGQGATWLATFDQDSQVPACAIADLLASYATLPGRDRVAVLAMSHRDRGTGRDYHRSGEIIEQTERWRLVRTTITSGSLVRVSALRQLGLFDARLFIDMVDLDFCLRCRRHGLQVVESRDVTLTHSLGDSISRVVLGHKLVLTRHSTLRRYYITRNQLEVCRRYIAFEPRWALGTLWDLAGGSAVTLLFEAERGAKLRAMLAGLRDFALRRFGPRP
jgi:rhamnosyltransferase